MSLVRVCERRKLRMNVCKSKDIRCLRYVNRGRMYVRQNDEPLEEANCFKYFGSQLLGTVFYGQERPSRESTTTECMVNYQLLAVMC